MTSSSSDFFTKIAEPGNATTLAAPGHSIGGTTINVDSTALMPTTTGIFFAIDSTTLVNGVETRTAGTYTVWEGTVASATSISNMVLKYGTDQNYAAGASTRVYVLPTAARENQLVDGLLVEHGQDGKHTDVTASTITTTGNADLKTVITDTVSEKTSAHGISLDAGGILAKDTTISVDHLTEITNAHGVDIDGATLKDGSAVLSTVTTSTIYEGGVGDGVTIDSCKIKDGLVTGGAGIGVNNTSLDTTAGQPGGVWIEDNNPTIGGFGTVTSKYLRYMVLGKTCFLSGRIVLSAGGTGSFTVTLPYQAKNANTSYIGSVHGNDTGTAYANGIALVVANGTTVSFFSGGTVTAQWGTSVPHTWANTDIISFTIVYEIA